MSFPDYSDQEEIIKTIGNCELLYKAGKKILRFDKRVWGHEEGIALYNVIKPFMHGDVFNIGLGMGNSADSILSVLNVDCLLCYEIEQDIIDMYCETHEWNPTLVLFKFDIFVHKPENNFDVILYELDTSSIEMNNKLNEFLTWVYDHLEENGLFILPYDRFNEMIAFNHSDKFNIQYLSIVNGRVSKNIWILMYKR